MMSDEQPIVVSSKVIAYALLGTAYAIKQTSQSHLRHQYREDRKMLQQLLEEWPTA